MKGRKKSTINRSVILLTGAILTLIFSLTGCKKDDPSPYASSNAILPLDKSAVAAATTTDLKWSLKAGSDGKWNVYYGENPSPDLYKAGYVSQVLNVPVVSGHTYYWKIGTVNNGSETFSPVYSFKVKVLLNIDKFTGLYDCNEPKYSHYEVNITKLGKDTLQVDNFWDLNWTLKYVFDDLGNVTIVPKTFIPGDKLTCSVSGSGKYNNETNEFQINYVVLQNIQGNPVISSIVDNNTHLYVKK